MRKYTYVCLGFALGVSLFIIVGAASNIGRWVFSESPEITGANGETLTNGTDGKWLSSGDFDLDSGKVYKINNIPIAATNLSDGANIAHINASETVTVKWVFSTASVTEFQLSDTTVSATADELNTNAGVTAGTVTASKTLVSGASNDLDTLTITNFTVGNVLNWSASNLCSAFTCDTATEYTTVTVGELLDSTDYVFLQPLVDTGRVVWLDSITDSSFVAGCSDSTALSVNYFIIKRP